MIFEGFCQVYENFKEALKADCTEGSRYASQIFRLGL